MYGFNGTLKVLNLFAGGNFLKIWGVAMEIIRSYSCSILVIVVSSDTIILLCVYRIEAVLTIVGIKDICILDLIQNVWDQSWLCERGYCAMWKTARSKLCDLIHMTIYFWITQFPLDHKCCQFLPIHQLFPLVQLFIYGESLFTPKTQSHRWQQA